MSFTAKAWEIFNRAVEDYHQWDDINAEEKNPFADGSLERLLYAKNWIDTVQWHLEDEIRAKDIAPGFAIELKRRIDASNQKRTDLVEQLDDWFFEKFSKNHSNKGARINTETPAWAIDRLSILALKIFHMKAEVERENADEQHREKCRAKLETLEIQHQDLSRAIDELLADIEAGKVEMKLYRQMKMYNDEALNPVLYQNKT